MANSQTTAQNYIQNATFELINPVKWERITWEDTPVIFEISNESRSGNHSITLSADKGGNAAWITRVPVFQNFNYRLSGWIKTDNVVPLDGKGALIVLDFDQERAKVLTGTHDWTYVEFSFNTGNRQELTIYCLLGGHGKAVGKAWFDDLQLIPLPTDRHVQIEATKTRTPISKYIYGQFIEHLGRCIYGGIWAEMLEDRKFFDPIEDKNSPWQVTGEKTSVKMNTENPFVGAHTPELKITGGISGGISQTGLGLVSGKKYDGYIFIAGEKNAAPINVNLVWGKTKNDRQTVIINRIDEQFSKVPLRFTAGAGTDKGRLEIIGTGKGSFQIGTVSLMPADNIEGFRADVLELLRELNSPIYRWPGGNFVSGYNWKDGIGDRDRRPPRKNPAWQGVEHNDVGIDEFIVFCRLIGTEPFIAINTGLGDAKMAAEEVEYTNGPVDSPMGKLRAENGHPTPYQVKWWAIGNEMYSTWQLGHIPISDYVKKHNEIVLAMLAVDAQLQLIGVGEFHSGWSKTMLQECADYMDFISEHIYRGEKQNVPAHISQITQAIQEHAAGHRDLRRQEKSLAGKDIRIAMDEWNYWYGPHIYGELGTRYFMKDALGIAAGLHEYFRQSDIYFMANYAQTVNAIGAIKTNKTTAAFATTGLVLKLYRNHFGQIPVHVSPGAAPLDICAAWTADYAALTIGIVNPTNLTFNLPMIVKGAQFTGAGKKRTIQNDNPMAFNEPGQAASVEIREEEVKNFNNRLSVLPFSVALFRLDVK